MCMMVLADEDTRRETPMTGANYKALSSIGGGAVVHLEERPTDRGFAFRAHVMGVAVATHIPSDGTKPDVLVLPGAVRQTDFHDLSRLALAALWRTLTERHAVVLTGWHDGDWREAFKWDPDADEGRGAWAPYPHELITDGASNG